MALQWEKSLGEYNSKHAVHCRLLQEIQGANTKVKGLQQLSNSLCVMVLSFGICMIFDRTSLFHQMCCSVHVLCLAYTPISQLYALSVTPRNARWGLLQHDFTLTCYYTCVKAIHKAGSDTQKVRYKQRFDLMWKRLLPLLQKRTGHLLCWMRSLKPIMSICKFFMISA